MKIKIDDKILDKKKDKEFLSILVDSQINILIKQGFTRRDAEKIMKNVLKKEFKTKSKTKDVKMFIEDIFEEL